MKVSDMQRRCDEINGYMDDGRIKAALCSLREMAEQLMAYEVSEAVDKVTDTYGYMLSYAMQGAVDPQRPRMYADIVERIRSLMDLLDDKSRTSDTPTLYYNVKRYEQLNAADTLAVLLGRYRHELSQSSLFGLSGDTVDEIESARSLESHEKRLFNRLWVTTHLSEADARVISEALADDVMPAHVRRLLLSSLTLGLMQYYDERRVMLLLDAYAAAGDDADVAMTALAGVLLGLYIHGRRSSASVAIASRLGDLRDNSPWTADVTMMFMEFIRTRDTERIDKTFREEIIPTITKIGPDLKRTFGNIDLENIDPESDYNPEWAELLDKSGISARLRELNEMQEQGADVMMSAFSSMKSFAFFNDISNWFMPFHTGHSCCLTVDESLKPTLDMMGEAMNLCDSDRYSLIQSVSSVPGAQLDMLRQAQGMAGSFDEMLEQVRHSRERTSGTERRDAANRYVRDMYRFFKLFRRKGEFRDPFDGRLNLLGVDLLVDDFRDIATVRLVAEFYFKHRQWDDALAVFGRIEAAGEISAQLYQKMGYCCQQAGNCDEALRHYRQAELLDAGSVWLLRRMARCLRTLGDSAAALEYYRRIDELQPDDFTTVMALGTLSLELGDYAGAMGQLHKAEFLDERSRKPRRPLAWAALMSGDRDKAARYYELIANDNPDSTDMLNMGHLALVSGDVTGAVGRYRKSVTLSGGSTESFLRQLKADSADLRRLGVPEDLMRLLPDLIDGFSGGSSSHG